MKNNMKFACASVVAVILSACATVENPMTLEVRDQFFLQSSSVEWTLTEKEQQDEDKKDSSDDGERAEGRKQLEEKLVFAVEDSFSSSPSGPNPMAFNIEIERYDRVGAVVGNIIGGSNLLIADVTVTDVNSGEVVATYNDVTGYYASNFGIAGALVQAATKPDIPGLMATSFAKTLKKTFESDKVKAGKEDDS